MSANFTWRRLSERKKRKPKSGLLKKIFIFILVSVFLLVFSSFIFLVNIISSLPDLDKIDDIVFAQSSTIYDRNGEELYTLHGDENRKSVKIEEIPYSLIEATISIEDDQFFEHSGFSVKGILGAVLSEIIHFGQHKRGGSTLTQQFVKNTFLTSEKTYTRKIKELILSLQLEWKFSKEKILEMYLNSIPYGSNAFGVEQASLTFFGKNVKDISLAESAILASLPKAPSYYSPYSDHLHTKVLISETEASSINFNNYSEFFDYIGEDNIELGLLPTSVQLNNKKITVPGRSSVVLNRMFELGSISKEKKDKTEEELLNYEFKIYKIDIKAPHFVMYVRDMLEKEYGADFVNAGGLNINTTLDYELQKKAEKIVLKQAKINEEKYGAKNSSVLVLDTKTGEILAMVGSRDYWDKEIDGNVNVLLQRRLPGSSFKPFAYTSAFLSGYAPSTVLFDVETDFGNGYKPQNYDGKFRGPVSMRKALGNSLNIPAIKAGILGGLNQTYQIAKKMGISFLKNADWYGSALSLGVAEIRPFDMAQAYQVFSQNGQRVDLQSFLNIKDKYGNLLYQKKETKKQVLNEEISYLVNDVLSDPQARGLGWNALLQLKNHQNAVKTGTSNKKLKDEIYPMDAWVIGYTPSNLVLVWSGNNDGSVMKKNASGYSTSGPIFKKIFEEVVKDKSKEKFNRPSGIRKILVSKLTGKLPPENFPKNLIKPALFSKHNVPQEYDNTLNKFEIDIISSKLPNKFTPKESIKTAYTVDFQSLRPDDSNWEKGVLKWEQEKKEKFLKDFGVDNLLAEKPTEISTVHTDKNTKIKPSFKIKSPQNQGTVDKKGFGVWLDINSQYGVSYVEYYLDEILVDTQFQPPYKGNINLLEDLKVGDSFSLKIKVYDNFYNSNSKKINLKVIEDKTPPYTKIVYPKDNETFTSSSLITVQTETYDNSDIKNLDFYLDNKKIKTVLNSPYQANLKLESGKEEYTIKVIAYDISGNKAEDSVSIKLDPKKISRDFKIDAPNQVNLGDSVMIKYFVPAYEMDQINEISLILRYQDQEGVEKEDLVLTKITNLSLGDSGIFNYLWKKPLSGKYALYLKTKYKNKKVMLSKKTFVEVLE